MVILYYKMKTVCISFGADIPNSDRCYSTRNIHLMNEMKHSEFFDEFTVKNEKDLMEDEYFWSKHGEFMSNPENSRGYGFWFWKPYLIHKTLNELEDGDFLVYIDAGCTVNPHGKARFEEYKEMLSKNEFGVLAFQLYACNDNQYSKRILLDFLNATDEHKTTPQIIATAIMFKKTPHSVNFVNRWYEIASNEKYINDEHVEDEYPEFVDHRHDQSIFSLLVKHYRDIDIEEEPRPIVIPDETYFPYVWHSQGLPYPFWGTRMRS
jgi:hypothetical protein